MEINIDKIAKHVKNLNEVLDSTIDFVIFKANESESRLDTLYTLQKDNEFADADLQETIFHERSVLSNYRKIIEHISNQLEIAKNEMDK
tara:strand:+ start:47 stop:313 length:267 start_codon:yes stop_codon:yes gene_type:complete